MDEADPIEIISTQVAEPKPEISKPTSNSVRRKITLSLTDLANGKTKHPEDTEQKAPSTNLKQKEDRNVVIDELKMAWDEFTEQRKSQVGEYHLLKQDFDFQNNLITIHLSNAVEEPLLQTIRTPLIEFLRERLSNNSINVTSKLKEVQIQKIAYTNKEKFDKLAESNPILIELKKRLDLDPDF